MTVFRFEIPGNPVPWQRTQSRGGQRFTAPATRAHQQAIQFVARKARIPCLAGHVKLTATFYRKSGQPCDVDNLVKSVSDALNGIAFHDDRQIVWLTAVKAIDRKNPRTEVEIEEVEAVPNTEAA